MRILGLDSATPAASVALVDDGQLVAEEFYDKPKKHCENASASAKGNHAEIVLPLIQSILDRAQFSLNDLSGIAVSIGPGSFTGLRVALATVKGIAYEWGLPVVGISSLHANAARVTDADGFICSLLDARKREVYAALFFRAGESLTRLSEDKVLPVEGVIELLRGAGATNCIIIGDGAKAYGNFLTSSLGAAVRMAAGAEYESVAAQVAKLSWGRFCAASSDDLGALVPLYLSLSEAQSKRGQLSLTC